MAKTKLPSFDKYEHYMNSVQNPMGDVTFLKETYSKLRSREAISLREDFCGTFAICCEWAKLSKNHVSYGVDLDPEPLAYGYRTSHNELPEQVKQQVHIREQDVLSGNLPHVDLACALNFSYFCFKERKTLKTYFQHVWDSLNEDGIFVMDCFGGSQCYEANEEETEHEDLGYSYFWDQDNYNPVNNNAMFFIHFQRKGEARREKTFVYNWRLWSIAELRDILEEVGFKSSHVYWEGTDEDGEGSGEFERTEMGEECESWIAYIAAVK